MRALLIFPPQGHFSQPYLSLPSLKAWLNQEGFDDVHQWDLSIESYDFFLSPARLSRALEVVQSRGSLADMPADGLGFSDMERYQALSEIELIGPELVERIDEAKAVLRTDAEFYDPERYLWAGRTIEQGLRLISQEYAPTRLSAHGFVMRYSIDSTADILAATEDAAENPYYAYFREEILPRLETLDPDLVGISLTFGSQAIPALTLARMIKAWKPSCHVTMGGGLLAYVGERLADIPALWTAIDSMVMLEGEKPLLELCRAVEAGDTRDLGHISNLVWCDSAGEVKHNPSSEPLNITTLPTPDFDGLPLDLYLSPELIMPLASTRGCYWGKCVFCTLYQVIGPGYRGRSIEQTVDDLRTLHEKYGARHFYLAIEDLPPNMARALPKALAEANLDIRWWCDARLEHDVFTEEICRDLYDAGCRRIAFGYESASPRVLDKMCKGIDPAQSMKLIERVHRAGISVTLYAMVGFPSETLEEAELTLSTILENKQFIQEVSVRVFYLDRRSEVFRHKEKFGIDEIYPIPGADLQVYYDFKAGDGMSRRQARDMYLRFTSALRSHFPVFQSDNMLYHELKGHYFLYLTKFGGWDNLCEQVLERDRSFGGLKSKPRKRSELRALPLVYDREVLDERLRNMDSHTLRPRFQSDLIEDEDRVRFDKEFDALKPEESILVHDPLTGEISTLSPAAWALLERCDGERSTEGIVEIFPPEARSEAHACLDHMAGAGLFEGARTPEEITNSVEAGEPAALAGGSQHEHG